MKKKKKKKINKTFLNLLIVFSFSIAVIFMYMTLMSYLDEVELKNESLQLQELYYDFTSEPINTVVESDNELPIESDLIERETPTPIISEQPTSTVNPIPTINPVVNDNFYDLLAINIDVVGWIKINGTTVDYPVLKGYSNDYYINHNIYGHETLSASIFMDYRNNIVNMNKNTIIYGHNMGNGYMFSNLDLYVGYSTRDDFSKEHSIITFNSLYKDMKFEIFSAYIEEVDGFQYLQTTFKNNNEFMEYINKASELSLIETDVLVKPDDYIITLSTCSHWYLDSRTVIHAKLITD
ncbi:MAG: class B sortase [Clostridiales bacterium]|nr:class B sortase [Clostridiales bacterium]